MAAYYVHRTGTREDLLSGTPIHTEGWTGPIDDPHQAEREAAAWRSVGHEAIVHLDTAATRARVAAWEDALVDGWRDSNDRYQRDRWREREEARREALAE